MHPSATSKTAASNHETTGKSATESAREKSTTDHVHKLEKSTTDHLHKVEESTNVAVKPGASEQQHGQGDGNPKPKKKSSKEKRRGKPGKIHIRLPPIEAYQKDLCFAAEAPGRVVVRLERLMGSDKIRPVDGKFMDTLIQRLEAEEKVAWEKKIRLRKKAEKERYRQLAISGLMEPGPGMQDLYNHPVFRVNRILNRLSSLDSTFSHNPALKLPPIVQVEPFEKDETGASFKEYPYHRALRKECEKYKDTTPKDETTEEEANPEEITTYYDNKIKNGSQSTLASQLQSKLTVSASTKANSLSTTPTPSVVSGPAPSIPSDMEEEDEYDEELLDENFAPEDEQEEEENPEPAKPAEVELTEIEQITYELNREYVESLSSLQKKYGVPNTPYFEDEWKPYQCEMVDKFKHDFEMAEDMFDAARALFEVYTRQAITVRDHEKKTTPKPRKPKAKDTKKQFKLSSKSAVELHSAPTLYESESEDEEETVEGGLSTDEIGRDMLEDEENEEGEINDDAETGPFKTGANEVDVEGGEE